ncbi:hypothetical protein [Streptomyces sp. NPDC048496]
MTVAIEAENGAGVAVARAAGFHLTDEPPLTTVDKKRPLTLQTWAHDRP